MKKLFIIFAILCLAVPVMAQDEAGPMWNFYGSARMATFYTIADSDIDNVDTVNRTQWALQGNSRFGANVKVNDQISGAFEYGSTPNLRKLFGKYTFGGGSELLVGQTYTPVSTFFYSNSVYDGDGDLLGRGQFYASRKPMIQWKTGGFKIALVSPNVSDGEGYVADLVIPKIEAAWNMGGDAFFFDIYGGFQTYGLDYVEGTDTDISSYVIGIGGGMDLGAFYFNLGGHYGQNLGQYGAYNPGFSGARGINIDAAVVNRDAVDNNAYGALLVLGMNLGDTWTVEAGAGFEEAELDADNASAENMWQAYVNATWNIVPGFFIVPELGYVSADYSDENDNDPNPNLLYVGCKWQINF